jgi:hypothetical protein
MGNLLAGADFDRLFVTFERTARRFETRDRYDVPAETEAVRQFVAGQWDEAGYRARREPFLDSVRAVIAAGRRRERVRVVPEPLTDFLRWELRISRDNVAAGEDIRYLHRSRADQLDLPDHDFWLFDDDRLALMYFTADDRFLGAQLVTDPDLVAEHRRWLDTAMPAATPYVQYLAEDPAREHPPTGGA